jgi:hypothetical protein
MLTVGGLTWHPRAPAHPLPGEERRERRGKREERGERREERGEGVDKLRFAVHVFSTS